MRLITFIAAAAAAAAATAVMTDFFGGAAIVTRSTLYNPNRELITMDAITAASFMGGRKGRFLESCRLTNSKVQPNEVPGLAADDAVAPPKLAEN